MQRFGRFRVQKLLGIAPEFIPSDLSKSGPRVNQFWCKGNLKIPRLPITCSQMWSKHVKAGRNCEKLTNDS